MEVYFYLFIFSMVLGCTQGFVLAMQTLYHLSPAASPFSFLVIFEIGSYFNPGPAPGERSSVFVLPLVVGTIGVCHYA
jgi:hypothetical protein